jgi:hypothetical protein
LHKSPCDGGGTGKNPTDRAKLGWKWSVLTDKVKGPFGWTAGGANRNDSILLAPTLTDAERRGLTEEIEITWIDRGYDSEVTRARLTEAWIDDAVIAKRRKRGNPTKATKKLPIGLRWPVERTNPWLSNYGQLGRTLTERLHTDSLSSPSQSPCSSQRSSSTGGTAGHRRSRPFAEPLRQDVSGPGQ